MTNFSQKDEKNFADLKSSFKDLGLPICEEQRRDGFMVFESKFAYESYPIRILILLDAAHDTVTVSIHYGLIPDSKKSVIYELINKVNATLCASHFAVHDDTGQLALLSGMYFVDNFINKKEFQRIVNQLLSDSYNFAPLIGKQIESDETPEVMFKKFLEENKDRIV
ncbi:MAG: YbjN domain-containing protein [Smithella sp.]|jgi:hypothetical protein